MSLYTQMFKNIPKSKSQETYNNAGLHIYFQTRTWKIDIIYNTNTEITEQTFGIIQQHYTILTFGTTFHN
jgi:hypothetical protein